MSTPEMTALGIAGLSLFGNVAQLVYGFRNNSSSVKNDIIETQDKRMSQMEGDIKTLTAKVDELTIKLDHSESERIKYLEILQGKDAQMNDYMKRSEKLLVEIHGAVMPRTVQPVS